MQIEQRIVGDVAVIKVMGDITVGKGGDIILKDKINSLLQQGQRKLLLDLGGVSYVDSAGLGQLVSVHATTTRQNGVLRLLNVTKRLKDLLVPVTNGHSPSGLSKPAAGRDPVAQR